MCSLQQQPFELQLLHCGRILHWWGAGWETTVRGLKGRVPPPHTHTQKKKEKRKKARKKEKQTKMKHKTRNPNTQQQQKANKQTPKITRHGYLKAFAWCFFPNFLPFSWIPWGTLGTNCRRWTTDRQERCRKRKCLTIFLKGWVRALVNQWIRQHKNCFKGNIGKTDEHMWAFLST